MSWPGTLMNSQMDDNWLSYTIYGVENPKVIFNDSKNKQIPEYYNQDIWLHKMSGIKMAVGQHMSLQTRK